MSKESLTYITYDSGLETKHLRLGNLVHDYENPNSFDPYVEKAYADIAEPPPDWARLTPLKDYSLTVSRAPAEGPSNSERYHVVAAEKALKIEIKDQKQFFNEITLKSDEAQKWLTSRISAAESLGESHSQPQIWMLTGLVLLTHATWTSVSSKEHSFVIGQPAPFDQLGVSALRRLSVSEDVKPAFGFRATEEQKEVEGTVIHETGKYPGTRGWAAQWQRVDVTILTGKSESVAKNQIKLKSSPKIAEVELEGSYAKSKAGESDGDFDDEYWDAFLDKAEEYV